MSRLDLQPFFRSTIGFDEIANLLDGLAESNRKPNQYPPYNIEKLGEEHYCITIAVAGFKEEDLEITKHNNVLTIEGRMNKNAEASKEHTYLYKGIAERSFQLQFRLADHMLIQDVGLENGMLNIRLEREVPEALKPQKIHINKKSKPTGKLIEGTTQK
jgi:molecular chaperone IbpA